MVINVRKFTQPNYIKSNFIRIAIKFVNGLEGPYPFMSLKVNTSRIRFLKVLSGPVPAEKEEPLQVTVPVN